MNTLGDYYLKQQIRLRQLLRLGYETGPQCAFYCAVIEQLLQRADRAAIEQDTATMIKVYEEMVAIS